MSEIRYTSRGMRRRGNTDKWEVVLSHKDPITGEIVPTYHTIEAKTEKQAQQKRNELILDLERKGLGAGSRMTLRDWLDGFIEYKERSGTVQRSTISDYRKSRNILCKYMGAIKICELSMADVNEWMAERREAGYHPKTITKQFNLLKQALKHAVAQEVLSKNVCEFCKPPRSSKQNINSLDKGERSRMIQLAMKAVPTPLAIAIILALTTGMRRGELCALRWSDFDEEAHTITVSRALGCDDGVFYIKDPKTEGSGRTIPLVGYSYEMLKACKDRTKRVMGMMELSVSDFYILGTQEPESRFLNPNRLTKDFKAFCDMHGFDCTLHDLRHTFATMLIAQGVDIRTVASYLGHANVAMTLNTYADVDPDAKKAAVSKIVESFNEDLATAFDICLTGEIETDESSPERMLEEIEGHMESALRGVRSLIAYLNSQPAEVVPIARLEDAS